MDDDLRRRMSPLSHRRGISEPVVRRPAQMQPEVRRPEPLKNPAPVPQVYVQPAPMETPKYEETAPLPVFEPATTPKIKNKPRRPKPAIKKRHLVTSVSAVLVIAVAFGLYSFIFSNKSDADNKGPALVTNLSKPNFMPLVPEGEAQLAHQASSTSFNKTHDSYSFDDLYLGVPIVVSEQPMPSNSDSSLTSNQIISGVAQKYGATTLINTQTGTAYVGDTKNSNKQVIVFDDKGILVFIQSSMNVQADAWVSYIDSLYQP